MPQMAQMVLTGAVDVEVADMGGDIVEDTGVDTGVDTGGAMPLISVVAAAGALVMLVVCCDPVDPSYG